MAKCIFKWKIKVADPKRKVLSLKESYLMFGDHILSNESTFFYRNPSKRDYRL